MWIIFGIVLAYLGIYIIVPVDDGKMYPNSQHLNELLNTLNERGMTHDGQIEFCRAKQEEISSRAFGENRQDKGEYTDTIYDDYILLDCAVDALERIYNEIPEYRTAVVKDALRNITEENAKSEPDMGVIRMNSLAVKKYNRIVDCEVRYFGHFNMVCDFYDDEPWDYVMIFFAVILTARMFTLDISRGSFKMVFSSKNGRIKLFTKQLSACFLVVGGIILLHTLIGISIGAICYGVNDFSLPVQMAAPFCACPFAMSIDGYYAVRTAGKLLFYFSCVTFTALAAILSKRTLPTAAAGVIFCLAPAVLMSRLYVAAKNEYTAITAQKTLNALKCFVPQSFLNIKTFFEDFDYAEIFGFPMSRIICVFCVTGILILAEIVISARIFGRETR